MRYATFMDIVSEVAGLTPPEAERAARATLETLAERISTGEAQDIAAFLPREMRSWLTDAPEPAEPFDLHEFYRRVAQRADVDEATAAEHARAVFVALGAAVAPGELRDMAAQLPREFEPLLEAAGLGRDRATPDDDLVGVVAQHAGIDRDQARRATEAVLEWLAVRISAGEVEDLEAELPADLTPALERGLAESRSARPMSADEFIAHIAEREQVSPDVAREHTRAVFAALREVISGKEFSDMSAQLSQDYAPLLAAAG